MKKTFTKLEKIKLLGLCIEAATGIIGGSLILSENHPYIALSVLALGAIASKIVSFIKDKQMESLTSANNEKQPN